VQARREDGRAVLEVEDDGRGIPEEERIRVFERFRRLDAQSTEGSGLGLAIVREIVERHGGTVQIREGRDGRGARVTVSFPASA
jgi:two-component system sensor histidine kinase TctE